MTEADKEIIEILKELFRRKDGEIIDPDQLLQEGIVKSTIYLALLCIVMLIPIKILGSTNTEHIDGILSGIVSLAFTFLFFHLNLKSKNPSLILYVLTWAALMAGLWLSN